MTAPMKATTKLPRLKPVKPNVPGSRSESPPDERADDADDDVAHVPHASSLRHQAWASLPPTLESRSMSASFSDRDQVAARYAAAAGVATETRLVATRARKP
jgi:hypothetical protein